MLGRCLVTLAAISASMPVCGGCTVTCHGRWHTFYLAQWSAYPVMAYVTLFMLCCRGQTLCTTTTSTSAAQSTSL